MDYFFFAVGTVLFVLLVTTLMLSQQPLWDSTFAPRFDFDGPENDDDVAELLPDDEALRLDDEEEELEPYIIANAAGEDFRGKKGGYDL